MSGRRRPRKQGRGRQPRTLRTRLVVSAVTLIAVVCAVIGTVTTFALRSHLYDQLDGKLRETAGRAAGPLKLGAGIRTALLRTREMPGVPRTTLVPPRTTTPSASSRGGRTRWARSAPSWAATAGSPRRCSPRRRRPATSTRCSPRTSPPPSRRCSLPCRRPACTAWRFPATVSTASRTRPAPGATTTSPSPPRTSPTPSTP